MSALFTTAAAWLAVASLCLADDLHWTYKGDSAPALWPSMYPNCGGSSQSPIDIVYTDLYSKLPSISPKLAGSCTGTDFKVLSHDFLWTYDASNTCTAATATSSEPPYNLLQVHVHSPSEHTFNGKHASAEIHFVHKMPSSDPTVVKLRVLGVALAVCYESGDNAWIASLLAPLPDVTGPSNTTIPTKIGERTALIPAGMKWFNYAGSLTTPPCDEVVDWWVAAKPVTISPAQFALLHEKQMLLPDDNRGMNARPAQPLNDRIVEPLGWNPDCSDRFNGSRK